MPDTASTSTEKGPKILRRGLLGAAAALGAALLSRLTTPAAHASNGQTVTVGNAFTSTSVTSIDASGGTSDAIKGIASSGNGISGATTGSGAGVYGYSSTTSGVGVWGNTANGIAVYASSQSGTSLLANSTSGVGVACNSANSAGVFGGSTTANGLYGSSVSGAGTYGTSDASVGVWGNTNSGWAVYASANTGAGVIASSNSGTAISGTSGSSIGVYGSTTGSYAVRGDAGAGTAIFGNSTSGYGAQFTGPQGVLINGPLSVTGIKSAVVPQEDGSYRRLYCVESPESWFEDFGRAELRAGQATVQLQNDFVEVVDSSSYHVFLTAEGESNGLYVTGKTATGFQVVEQQGGKSHLSFSYRVVAKRKDVSAPRLEKVLLPTPEPKPELAPRRTPAPPPRLPAPPASH